MLESEILAHAYFNVLMPRRVPPACAGCDCTAKRSERQNQCLASDKLILINVTWLSPSQVLFITGVQASKSGWGEIGKMSIEHLPHSVDSPLNFIFESRERRTVASYQRELKRERIRHSRTETELREALAQEEILLHQKDELIQQQEILSKETDHRLLNDLQMIVSLLSMQSRASTNAEVASQLAAAADRVATIGTGIRGGVRSRLSAAAERGDLGQGLRSAGRRSGNLVAANVPISGRVHRNRPSRTPRRFSA